jgi:hypothetical protein
MKFEPDLDDRKAATDILKRVTAQVDELGAIEARLADALALLKAANQAEAEGSIARVAEATGQVVIVASTLRDLIVTATELATLIGLRAEQAGADTRPHGGWETYG